MERSEERKKIGSDTGGANTEGDEVTAKAATAKEAALDEENEAVIKEKAEETARELSAAAAVDINFVADGTPLAENSAQNFEQNGNEPKIGKIEDEIAPAAVAQAAGTAVIMPFASSGKTYDFHVNKVKKKPVYAAVKRIFDFVVCLIAAVVLLPLFLIIAIGIKCSSKGPVFYVQERVGYKGKIIKVPKFRTMRVDAEKNGAQWSEGDKDPRIYPFGRFLRKARLDELPQLWCCVIGTMSLVGPRPERECFSREFEKYIHGWPERVKVKPGITGWAQVNGGYDLKPEEKIVYDLEYIEKRSVWLDIKILFKTVAVVFDHDGAK